ncbi:MAG: flagellar hook-associated protein FlgL [Lautropia sp.]
MRVATGQFTQQAIDGINRRTEALQRLQQQITTGKRINQASDDPVAAAESERIRSTLVTLGIEQRMMTHATAMLGQADGALASGAELLQSARELLVGAGNGSYGPEDRAIIALQLTGIRDELLSVANQSDGAGGYVFGGQGSATPPFTTAGTPLYQANAGTQQTGIGMSFDTTVDGSRVFIGDGAGATTGSIFASLDTIIGQLRDPALDNATLRTALDTALAATDASLGRVSTARTEVGEQLRALESRGRLIESGELRATGRLSEIADTDYAAAISEMQTHQLAINAAMQTYAQIARLSLFDYL